MVLNILGIGKMINNKVMANKNGKMEHFIKVITEVGKSKEMVLLFGEMTALIKVNFYKTIFMVKASMFGKMEEFIKVNGLIIKCMEKVFSFGLMAENTKVNIKMIKNMGLVFLHLKMAEFMKDNGKMVNNMDVEFIKRRKYLDKVFGKMVSGLNG